jgi:hypothetical protein
VPSGLTELDYQVVENDDSENDIDTGDKQQNDPPQGLIHDLQEYDYIVDWNDNRPGILDCQVKFSSEGNCRPYIKIAAYVRIGKPE